MVTRFNVEQLPFDQKLNPRLVLTNTVTLLPNRFLRCQRCTWNTFRIWWRSLLMSLVQLRRRLNSLRGSKRWATCWALGVPHRNSCRVTLSGRAGAVYRRVVRMLTAYANLLPDASRSLPGTSRSHKQTEILSNCSKTVLMPGDCGGKLNFSLGVLNMKALTFDSTPLICQTPNGLKPFEM